MDVVQRSRVLIVEDDPDLAIFLVELMQLWGLPRQVASNGRSALESMRIEMPDILLVDLDGGQALADFGPLRSFVIAISSQSNGESGVDVLFLKPVNLEQLRAAIETRSTVLSCCNACNRAWSENVEGRT